MKVWIVSRGEIYEGSKVVGVFSSYAAAVNEALKEPAHFDGGWRSNRVEDPCYFFNGCDYVEIKEWAVA